MYQKIWIAILLTALAASAIYLWQFTLIGAVARSIFGPMASLVGLGAIYLLPGLVAYSRSHPNTGAIFALNLFLGWTLLGWVLALVWSLTAVNPASQPTQPTPSPAAGQTDHADHPA